MQVQERRNTRRYASSSKGYAVLNGVDLDLKTHDISSAGALVEFNSICAVREGLKLLVHLDIGYIGSAVICRTIKDKDRSMFALKFEQPIPVAITLH